MGDSLLMTVFLLSISGVPVWGISVGYIQPGRTITSQAMTGPAITTMPL